ncbi:MAG: Zn-ribbon domain-containing OB-fold protein, partial [Dehalococcoidia bacterium]
MRAEQTEAILSRVSVSPSYLKLTGNGTEGVLLGSRCRECNLRLFGQPMFCPRCTSGELKGIELSSSGTLYSYTVIYVPPPEWKGKVPYVLGSVQLPEGPRVVSE